MLETLDLFEFGDTSYLQHHVRAAGYWDNAMEKCCIPQNTDSLSREETQEHTVTPKFFSDDAERTEGGRCVFLHG